MNQKRSTCLNISLILAMTCPAGQASTSQSPGCGVTIHVYNYARLPEKTLARAEKEGGGVFRDAGLTVLWIHHAVNGFDRKYHEGSTDSWDGTHLVLRLLTEPPGQSSESAMGEAFSPEIANVFVNRVKEQAAVGELSVGRILGHVIAHEMGHLLLGYNSHSPGGIMVAPWSKQDFCRMSRNTLRFTHQEAERIQAEVRRRTQPLFGVADSTGQIQEISSRNEDPRCVPAAPRE